MNKFICTGRFVADPESRVVESTKGKTQVANFRLAVNVGLKRQDSKAAFLDFEAWDKQAELITQHFKKGDPIIIDDSEVRQEEWEKDGQRHSRYRYRVNRFEFPPSKSGGQPRVPAESVADKELPS